MIDTNKADTTMDIPSATGYLPVKLGPRSVGRDSYVGTTKSIKSLRDYDFLVKITVGLLPVLVDMTSL